ncbi:TetR/AcrR family transcriptional regulator [Amycolatopsis sp. NPDC059021]|uniref:TetR/AcrR family transcriptional regulator n=1 Tax=Amycolatopsis sp. NPDC059021 TaxID=3346704 RepID=UPI00366E7615
MSEPGTAERIASVALAILVHEGAQAVTMRRVAMEAGVTAMATYRHYPNREALLRKVAEDALADIGKDWGNRTGEHDFESRLHGLMRDFLDFALGKPNLYRFLMTDRREEARKFPEDFRDGASPAFSPVLKAVEQAIHEGELRPGDAIEVTLAITMPVVGLVQFYLGGRIGLSEKDFRALCARTVERVLDGTRK